MSRPYKNAPVFSKTWMSYDIAVKEKDTAALCPYEADERGFSE